MNRIRCIIIAFLFVCSSSVLHAQDAPLSVAVAPVSVEGSLDLDVLLELETHRQQLIVHSLINGWTVCSEADWGPVHAYGWYPAARALARAGAADLVLRVGWRDGAEYIEYYDPEYGGANPWRIEEAPEHPDWISAAMDEIAAYYYLDRPLVEAAHFAEGTGFAMDEADLENWGFRRRVEALQTVLTRMDAEGLALNDVLAAARLYTLQSAYRSLTPNRPWIVHAARGRAWLQVAAVIDAVYERDDAAELIAEISALADFFVLGIVPPADGRLRESAVIADVMAIQPTASGVSPPIDSLLDALVRQRTQFGLSGLDSELIRFSKEAIRHSYGYVELPYTEPDIGAIVIWDNPITWISVEFSGGYRVTHVDSYPTMVRFWLTSFNDTLFALFPEARPSGGPEGFWEEPWMHGEFLLDVLTGDGESMAEELNLRAYYDLVGFALAAYWDASPVVCPASTGFALTVADISNDFLTGFQEFLRAHRAQYGNWGWTDSESSWDAISGFYPPEMWRFHDTIDDLVPGGGITTPKIDVYADFTETWDRLHETDMTRDQDTALELAEELLEFGVMNDNWTVIANYNQSNTLSKSPLASIFYRAGQVQEGLTAMTSLPSVSSGPETVREDILLLAEDLEAWEFYFQPTRNSHADRFTRIRYTFQTGDYRGAAALADENMSHYGTDSQTSFFRRSALLILDPARRTPTEWELLGSDLNGWSPWLWKLPDWYESMDAAMDGDPGWLQFRSDYNLDLIVPMYRRLLPFYLGQSAEIDGDATIAVIADTYSRLDAEGDWGIYTRQFVAREWSTMVARRMAALDVAGKDASVMEPLLAECLEGAFDSWRISESEEWTGLLSYRLQPLFSLFRAVRFGADADRIAEIWFRAARRADPSGAFLNHEEFPADIRGILSSPSVLADYAERVHDYSETLALEDLDFPNIGADWAFEKLFTSGDDILAVTLAFLALEQGDPSLFFPYLSEEEIAGWCRRNAPNGTTADEWTARWHRERWSAEWMLEDRVQPLPESIPSFYQWLSGGEEMVRSFFDS